MALSNGVRLAIGAGGAVVAVVAVVLGLPLVAPPPAATDTSAVASGPPGASDGAAPAEPAGAEAVALPPTDVTPPGVPAADDTDAAAAPEVQPLSLAPPSMVPVFDVVRIEPDGTGVVAGQALAGMTVAIMVDNAAVVETVADASGRFVDFLTLAPSDKPRVLSLVADPDGAAVLSSQSVVIAPTPQAGPVDDAGAVALSGDPAGPEGAESAAAAGEVIAADGSAVPAADTADSAPADPEPTAAADVAAPVVAPEAPGEEAFADQTAEAVAAGASEAASVDPSPGEGPRAEETAQVETAVAGEGPNVDAPEAAAAGAQIATLSEPGQEVGGEEADAVDSGGVLAGEPDPGRSGTDGAGAAGSETVASGTAIAQTDPAGTAAAQTAVAETGSAETGVAETGAAETDATGTEAAGTAVAQADVAGGDGAAEGLTVLADPLTDGAEGSVAQAPVAAAGLDAPPAVVSEIVPVVPEPIPASAPPVLMVDEAGVRVLQPARTPLVAPELLRTVALDAISYDDGGDVAVSGRATSAGTVRLYLDNALLGEAAVQADGGWRLDLQDVPAGLYTLRADQVSTEGAVLSRIETPFLREERDTIAAVMAEDTAAPGFNVAVRTVQPGNTLWAIARDRYGEGILYVAVFEANQDLIRDPDLIYPGQVFRLPELPEAAPETAPE